MEPHSFRHMSRRALLETLVAAGSLPLLAESRPDAQVQLIGAAPRPFRVDIPQATVDRILNRVRETRWPDRLEASDWRYGANWDTDKKVKEAVGAELKRRGLEVRETTGSFHVKDPDGFDVQMGGKDQ